MLRVKRERRLLKIGTYRIQRSTVDRPKATESIATMELVEAGSQRVGWIMTWKCPSVFNFHYQNNTQIAP